MLVTKGLKHTYDENTVIHMPDMSCKKGDRLLILGASGTGKTTLLNLLGGLLQIQEGELIINEKPIKKLSTGQLDKFRGENIGFIFQKPHFVSSLNVMDNILLAQTLSGKPRDRQRATNLLTRLNIHHLALKMPDQISVGEQQRANIARALINKPALVLADEPTSALDDHNCREVLSLLEDAASAEGATLVIVTHDQRLKDHFTDFIQL